MKRLLFLFFLIASPLWATMYYVRNDGHDTATGVNNTTDVTTGAWLTAGKACSTATAADTVKFKDDHTWSEMCTVANTGTAGNILTFTRTADGTNKPILSERATIGSGWSTTLIAGVSADIMSETWDAHTPNYAFNTAGSGYTDLNGWVGLLGTSNTMDGDSVTIADELGGSTDNLKLIRGGAAVGPRARWRTSGDKAVSYTQFYVYPSVSNITNGQSIILVNAQNTAFDNPWQISLYLSGTQYQLQLQLYNNGANAYYYQNISLGAWYKVEIKYDYTNKLVAWYVGGLQVGTDITLTGTYKTGPRDFRVGDGDTAFARTYTAYFGAFKVGSTGFYSGGSGSANVWKATVTKQPTAVYMNGTLGTLVANIASITSEFKWYWDSLTTFIIKLPCT